VLKNQHVCVKIDRIGRIVSFRTSEGRELAGAPMNELHLYKDVPRLFDAWDIDSNYIEQEIPLTGDAELSIACAEGLTAAVRIRRRIGNSSFEQVISLKAHENTVKFDTTADWHELHRLLNVSFATTVFAENALHEIQFGYVERPTHRSRAYDKDRFEVCNHRYTALTDQAHGCAVLNDSKYGVSTEGGTISLTLLRAAASPEMQADNGVHHFTYAFEAWEGAFKDAPVVQDGLRLNAPVAVAPGTTPACSLFRVDAPNIILDTVKPAEDGSGDIILRLYESKKCDTAFTLTTALAVKSAALCNMLEQPEKGLPAGNCVQLHAKPFEIITLRVKV
jgi:alpha-mannosidase